MIYKSLLAIEIHGINNLPYITIHAEWEWDIQLLFLNNPYSLLSSLCSNNNNNVLFRKVWSKWQAYDVILWSSVFKKLARGRYEDKLRQQINPLNNLKWISVIPEWSNHCVFLIHSNTPMRTSPQTRWICHEARGYTER